MVDVRIGLAAALQTAEQDLIHEEPLDLVWMSRAISRAPYSGEYPVRASHSRQASDTSSSNTFVLQLPG